MRNKTSTSVISDVVDCSSFMLYRYVNMRLQWQTDHHRDCVVGNDDGGISEVCLYGSSVICFYSHSPECIAAFLLDVCGSSGLGPTDWWSCSQWVTYTSIDHLHAH